MDQSELIEQFCAITASDKETAERYLAVADQNLETAITLFLEGGGQSFASQQQPSQFNTSSGSGTGTPASSAVGASGIEEDDEALVRRLQQEEYNSTDNDGVREVIRPVTETLVEPGYGGGSFGNRYRAPPVQRPRDIFGRGRSNDDDDGYGYGGGSSSRQRHDNNYYNDDEDEEEESDDQDEGMTPAQSRLSKLFRPPYEIISNYDLETAQNYGRLQKKWILVNIQNSTEFQSHVLNRDIWANNNIKTLVKSHFIFLQYNHDSYEGQDFKSYYPFQQYPYVGILDPRTGEQMKAWSFQLPSPDEFLDQLRDFLAAFSLDPKAKNPMSRQKQDVSRMTEEDQIQYALKKSLGGAQSSDEEIIELDGSENEDFHDFDDDEEYVMDSDVEILDAPASGSVSTSNLTPAVKNNLKEAPAPEEIFEEEEEEEEDLTDEDIFAMIPPHEYPEPPAGVPNTTRIQFRLGDGTRVIRRFELSDTVKQIFGVVKTINETTRTSYFSLTKGDTKENLLGKLDKTIKEAGLSNNSILVEVLD